MFVDEAVGVEVEEGALAFVEGVDVVGRAGDDILDMPGFGKAFYEGGFSGAEVTVEG